MNDKQRLLIDCISLLPVIGILVLITVANDQFVTMVAAYVLCGELLCVLVSRILNLYYIDVAFVWLGGVMLWLWYWFWLESSHVVMEIVEKTVGWIASFHWKNPRSFLYVFVYNFFGFQWDRECGFTFTAFISKKQILYKTCWEIESQWLVWMLL